MRISDWSADVCSSDLAMYNETQPGGYLYENEFKREGLHVLFAVITSPYEVMTARKPITGLDAMQGLKLKTAGRSEERRVGKECVSTCRARWSPSHHTKKH